MGLFNRKREAPRPAAPPRVHFTSASWNPDLVALEGPLHGGDWQGFADHLATLRDDPEARADAVRSFDELAYPAAREWVAALPDSPDAQVFAGKTLTSFAWEVRSARLASEVSAEQFERFHALLAEAEEHLLRAARLDPHDALPYVCLLESGMGLGVSAGETRRRFEEGRRRAPQMSALYHAMVGSLTQKWGGSHREMFEFARWAHLTLPDGDTGRVALLTAHAERWLYHAAFDEDGGDVGYFRRPDVQRELDEVAQRSIWSPSHRTTRSSNLIHNTLAWAAFVDERREVCAGHLAAVGDAGSTLPWAYLGDEHEVFAEARQWALG